MNDFGRMLGMLIDFGAKTGMDIIELGCAPGRMLRELFLMRPDHNYFGIDYSADGLAITKQFLKESRIDAELIYGDIRTYIPDRTYDMVVSFGLVEHFDDPSEILEAHKKFAHKNGWVIASVPNLANRYVKKALEKFRPADLRTHNLNIMSQESLMRAFSEIGLKNIQTGGAVGPLLPTPTETPTLTSEAYRYFSYIWNGSIRFIPPSLTWNAYYWAAGQT
jgi:2-polyprenyl-3-methyl-5-hydroxy-6-metoxy-1,4-benzoquinol methylase